MFKMQNVPMKLSVKVEPGKILAGPGAVAVFRAIKESGKTPEKPKVLYASKHK